MDDKARLRRLGAGMAITVAVTVVVAALFGSLAVPLSLAIGLGATLLLGGGRDKG